MPSFTVTAVADKVTLDKGTGAAAFTVTNTSTAPIQGRLIAQPEKPADQSWFTIEGSAVRTFPPNAAEQVSVKVAPPAGTKAGAYSFRLVAAAEANPDEDFTEGPTVSFQLGGGAAIGKKFPIWIIPVILVVLLGAGVGAYFLLKGDGGGTTTQNGVDADGDGFRTVGTPRDCDDTKADVNPGATDRPGDGIDQDCDGDDATQPVEDEDGDGFAAGEDCDDTDKSINPDADDKPGDGIDQDCSGKDTRLPTVRIEAESLLPAYRPEDQFKVEKQPNCCGISWSGGYQVFYANHVQGRSLALRFRVDKTARYKVQGVFTKARNFGIFELEVDGEILGEPFDAWAPDEELTGRITFGTKQLRADRRHVLELTVVDHNPSAEHYFVGIDRLILIPQPPPA